MKTTLILLGLCAVALAIPPQSVVPKKYKVADKVFLEREKDILRLFKYINQPTYYKDFVDIASSFSFEQYYQQYTYPQYVKEFMVLYKTEILQKGQIFSVFYQEHLQQAIALFKVFYYAKDFETFFKTAVWARQYVNEGLFIYAFSVALIHHPDTYGFILPPIYEIYPYYFFPSEVITKVQKFKQIYYSGTSPPPTQYGHGTTDEGYSFMANYSGWYLNLNPEQSLSYFTEDIGLNSYYYYYNLYYPFWMDGKEFNLSKDKRGELFYFVHQQLLARYYLERLSNNLGTIPAIKSDFYPLKTGYYPSLTYPSGLPFPSRPNNIHVTQQWGNEFYVNFTDTLTYVQDYAIRIREAIDLGYVYTYTGEKVFLYDSHGFEILGNLIQSNPDSPNSKFYGSLQIFVSYLMGYSYYPLNKYYLAPSVLEHFETSLRDPVFYQYFKWIVHFFQKYKYNLPYYTYEQLDFPGVKVVDFTADRLITYFEPFYSDLSNAAYYSESEFETVPPIKAYQYRLNHKPFSYSIKVKSSKDVEALVKVFIGPKYDEYGYEIDITDNYMNFVLFDKFIYKLTVGENIITHSSTQSYYVSDRTTWQDLYKNVIMALKGNEQWQIDGSESYWGFPNRLLLPKGTYGGQTYQFYVYIMPYTQTTTTTSKYYDTTYYPKVGTGGYYMDDMPFGFPFDRYVYKPSFDVPNSYFYDAVIYHKKFEDLNVSH